MRAAGWETVRGMVQHDATSVAKPTAVTDEACVAACNAESLALPEARPPESPPATDHACVADPERWWPNPGQDPLAEFDRVSVGYNGKPAVVDVAFPVPRGSVVALIGPSGSGKSTLIRCMNRMNDLVRAARVDGRVMYRGVDLYGPKIDAVQVRKRIGMVFQKPNPFPKSIYDNVAFGPRVIGFHGDLDEIVERALRRAAIWDEVKDRLRDNAFGLSGGQQQRLVIARCLAVEPDVLLMDEPASALDPISAGRIEDLMRELTPDLTIVIVTHNLQQAGRVADFTAFLNAAVEDGAVVGRLVEFGSTEQLFSRPSDERTEAYLSGRFG
jgi:phosphate transport system ATP-binding protein